MKAPFLATLSVALLIAVAPAPAVAQTVYNGGAPNGQAGFDIFNDFRSADDITATSPLAFNLIRFWGLLPAGSSYVPTIFWQFLSDGGGGVPGSSVVAEGTTLANRTLRTPLDVGFDSWQFDLALGGPRSLAPGVYWLALHDGALGDITDSTLLWETTDAGSGSQFAVDFVPTGEWTGNWGANLAFELRSDGPTTVVPEPGTMMLVGVGLAGLAGVARRRFRA